MEYVHAPSQPQTRNATQKQVDGQLQPPYANGRKAPDCSAAKCGPGVKTLAKTGGRYLYLVSMSGKLLREQLCLYFSAADVGRKMLYKQAYPEGLHLSLTIHALDTHGHRTLNICWNG
jgi:hypothetical protein